MTLGRQLLSDQWVMLLSIISFSGTFLDYHPNIAATGEIPFFENDYIYKRGFEKYIKRMPSARFVSYRKTTYTIHYWFHIRDDQLVLAKSPAVWYQKDVHKVLVRHRGEQHILRLLSLLYLYSIKDLFSSFVEHLPNVKLLLIVRDPIGENNFEWNWR